MFGDLIQFECFHMREWLRVSKAGNWIERRARTCADDHVGSAELAPCAIWQRGLHSPRAGEVSIAENEFRSRLFIILEIQIVQSGHHSAFPAAHYSHIHCEIFAGDAELFASANVRC